LRDLSFAACLVERACGGKFPAQNGLKNMLGRRVTSLLFRPTTPELPAPSGGADAYDDVQALRVTPAAGDLAADIGLVLMVGRNNPVVERLAQRLEIHRG
jgi:hypothetical protein